MLSIVTVDSSTPWQYGLLGLSQGIGRAPAIVGCAIGKYSRGPQLRTTVLDHTGLLNQTGPYGDSSQACNGVIHRDVEGSIVPKGLVENDGHLLIATATPDQMICFENGDYHFSTKWETSSGYATSQSFYKFYQSSKGFVVLWNAGPYSVWYPIRWDMKPPKTMTWNWETWNYADGSWYHRGGYVNVDLPQDNPKLAVSLFLSAGSRLMLDKWPTGQPIGWRTGLDFSRVLHLPAYSPNLDVLRQGARNLANAIPQYRIPAALEKKLYADCVEGQNCFTSNGIAYAQDIGKVGDSIRALLGLISDPGSPKQWASTWLSLRFSDRLTYQDSSELIGAIRSELERLMVDLKFRESRAHCTYSYSPTSSRLVQRYDITSNARLRCENESYTNLMSAVKKLMEWDVWPTLENTWDMIPLSFVVDWFTNLSQILTNVDRLVYEQYLRVRIYERSDKIRVHFAPDAVAHAFGTSPDFLVGSVTGKLYTRQSAERPQLGILDGWDPSLPAPVNYLDSAALLVQAL